MICNPYEEILFLTRALISKELLTLGPVPTRAEVRQFVITILEKEKRPEK